MQWFVSAVKVLCAVLRDADLLLPLFRPLSAGVSAFVGTPLRGSCPARPSMTMKALNDEMTRAEAIKVSQSEVVCMFGV